jgi:hypothetical protein
LEWWRFQTSETRGFKADGSPLNVLSVDCGNVLYDLHVAKMLAARTDKLQYTILTRNSAYSSKRFDDTPELKGSVEIVNIPSSEDDKGASSSALLSWKGRDAGYDVVHTCLWSSAAPDGHGQLLAASCARWIAPNGVALVFKYGPAGVFELRNRLHDALSKAPGAAEGAPDRLSVEDPDGTGCNLDTLRAQFNGCKGGLREELIDSQVDMTGCLMEDPTDAASMLWAEAFGITMDDLTVSHPRAVEVLLGELCEMSLAADAGNDSVTVFAPVAALIAHASSSGPLAAWPAPVQRAWVESGMPGDRCADASRVLRPLPIGSAPRRARGQEVRAQHDVIRVDSNVADGHAPHGPRGAFFNVGKKNWLRVRAEWNELGDGVRRPPSPPDVDLDLVAQGLSRVARSFQLPGPMRLGTLVDLYVELWEEDY